MRPAVGLFIFAHGECYKNKYEPLDLSCVESHLKKYVKEKDLQAYNAALPSEEEINDYAHKMSVYKTITNGGVALKLRVLNKGTAKATDIRISIVWMLLNSIMVTITLKN